VNLYIGGCSLYTHWENASNDLKNYSRELNGKSTGEFISVKDGLLEDKWDYITLQQASHDSGMPETYFPYISNLSEYAGKYAPDSTQIIHQTWAYETDSVHNAFSRYEKNQQVMYSALKNAYIEAAAKLGLKILPCGDVIQALRKTKDFDYANGGLSLCRDGFHLSLDYGRYTAAAVWYEILAGNISANGFAPENTDKTLINLIKRTVSGVCSGAV
jgi:hypothetical protein